MEAAPFYLSPISSSTELAILFSVLFPTFSERLSLLFIHSNLFAAVVVEAYSELSSESSSAEQVVYFEVYSESLIGNSVSFDFG